MTSAAYIRTLLISKLNELPELSADHIHTFFIPTTDKSTDVLIVVIKEIPDGSQLSGNDEPLIAEKQVQLDFYYPKKYLGDMDMIESKIKSGLLQSRVRCFSDAGHVITPDSENITNTLKFKYTKEIL